MSKYSDIATFGCSFLVSSYDYEPEQNRRIEHYKDKDPNWYTERSFPNLLQKKAKIPVENYAMPGHSNDFSLRKAYSYITNRDKNKGKGLAIIGLTHLARTEYTAPFDPIYHHVTPSDCHLQNGQYIQYFKKHINEEKFQQIVSENYKFFYNEDLRIEELKARLNMLHAYGKMMNVDLIVFFSFPGTSKTPGQFADSFLSDTNLFNLFNFGFRKNITVTWHDFIKTYDSSYQSGHPFYNDTKILADLMYDYIYSEIPVKTYIKPIYRKKHSNTNKLI